jgi:hypothetical protein
VRGVGLVKAPAAQIATLLLDTSYKAEWVPGVVKAVALAREADGSRLTEYSIYAMPWPFADRDWVYELTLAPAPVGGAVQIDVRGSTHDAPATVGVRGQIHACRFRLVPQSGGTTTLVDVFCDSDPRGSLPAWFVNQVARRWPQRTLERLRAQVAMERLPPHPLVQSLTEGILAQERLTH